MEGQDKDICSRAYPNDISPSRTGAICEEVPQSASVGHGGVHLSGGPPIHASGIRISPEVATWTHQHAQYSWEG